MSARPLQLLCRLGACLALVLPLGSCDVLDLCPPNQFRAGFLSQGDCVFTRSASLGGHEWLTTFANDDLRDSDGVAFTDREIGIIVEGNRRVDFPKHLLVHLNSSALAYLDAINEYHDAPHNQPKHFLLDDRNTRDEAAEAAYALIEETSVQAVAEWDVNRTRSLTRMGQVCHTIQDSFSVAHTRRDPERDWCILKVKAYMPRAEGFLDDDIEFHGADDGDTIGHITPQDSIYREGRECREPSGREAIETCLSEPAQLGRAATRDYLHEMLRLTRESADEDEVRDSVQALIDAHMALCSAEPAPR